MPAPGGPLPAGTSPELSDAQFERVREWVYRRTGIQFAVIKRYYVEKCVAECVGRRGGGFETWFAQLRPGGDPVLGQELINELTINETYFLREDQQFQALIDTVLPAIAQQRRGSGRNDPIRLLSLPCSTGEEPYSIALRMMQDWPGMHQFDVEIVGGDIDTRVLDRAREAIYGPRSMQRLTAAVRSRCFDRLDAERWQVKAAIRDVIDFRTLNICELDPTRPLRPFDVVFCRNLLIYFDAVSARRATENLFGALRPGGYLFLGRSESMSRIAPIFLPVRLAEGMVYRRPESPEGEGR